MYRNHMSIYASNIVNMFLWFSIFKHTSILVSMIIHTAAAVIQRGSYKYYVCINDFNLMFHVWLKRLLKIYLCT